VLDPHTKNGLSTLSPYEDHNKTEWIPKSAATEIKRNKKRITLDVEKGILAERFGFKI